MRSGTLVHRQSGLTLLTGGFCSASSPRWFEGLLWFSDPVGAAVHTVNLRGSVTTVPLPGHVPGGLGFCPDGSLLIASAEDRRVLRYDGESVAPFADLSGIVRGRLGDMVVDDLGRAYLGCQDRHGGLIVRIDPNAQATVVADGLQGPAGMVVGTDQASLIVAESIGERLTAYRIGSDGTLLDRRVFAAGLDGPPEGIALDADGGVWTAMTLAHQFQRIGAGGDVTDRIDIGDGTAMSCALGGAGSRILFLVSSTGSHRSKSSRVDAMVVGTPSAGWL